VENNNYPSIDNNSVCIVIYKITNILNGKIYVGQTVQDPKIRWRRHKNAAKDSNGESYNLHLYCSMRKHGEHNFKFEIIEEHTNLNDANIAEIKYISNYNSTNKKFGYNNQTGGRTNFTITEETRKKLSDSHMGKKLSEESIRKVVEANTIFSKEEEKIICNLYTSQIISCNKIAKQFNCSGSLINRALNKYNIQTRNKSDYKKEPKEKIKKNKRDFRIEHGLSKEDDINICELYEIKKYNIKNISKIYKVSAFIIRKILKFNNLEIRLQMLTKAIKKEICMLYDVQNIGSSTICKKFNISAHTVLRILHENNIKIRNVINHLKLTKEDENKICELYNNGNSSSKIAKTFNVCSSKILSILHSNNVKIKTVGTQNLTEKNKKRICFLYENKKLSHRKIADIFNISTSAILNIIRSNNITIRPQRRRLKIEELIEEQKNNICNLYKNQNFSFAEIAKKLQIPMKVISIIIKNNNIKIRIGNKCKISEENQKKICVLYQEKKLSTIKIGALFNVNCNTIRNILISNNIKIRKRFNRE